MRHHLRRKSLDSGEDTRQHFLAREYFLVPRGDFDRAHLADLDQGAERHLLLIDIALVAQQPHEAAEVSGEGR